MSLYHSRSLRTQTVAALAGCRSDADACLARSVLALSVLPSMASDDGCPTGAGAGSARAHEGPAYDRSVAATTGRRRHLPDLVFGSRRQGSAGSEVDSDRPMHWAAPVLLTSNVDRLSIRGRPPHPLPAWIITHRALFLLRKHYAAYGLHPDNSHRTR